MMSPQEAAEHETHLRSRLVKRSEGKRAYENALRRRLEAGETIVEHWNGQTTTYSPERPGPFMREKVDARYVARHLAARHYGWGTRITFTKSKRDPRRTKSRAEVEFREAHGVSREEVRRRDRSEARELLREAVTQSQIHTRKQADALYEKLVRSKRRMEEQSDDPAARTLSKRITHVLSKYVGPASRGTFPERLKARGYPSRDRSKHPRGHRSKSAPTFAMQEKISHKIKLLVREGYSPKQAAAIAYKMLGVARPRSSKRRA